MVVYRDSDRLSSGLPLGGIGTGKLEIDNKIKIVNVTIANNWNNPIKILRGFHIFIKPEELKEGLILQKNSGITRVREINGEILYEGKYPILTIKTKIDKINVTIQAFSPIIQNDIKNSTIPAVGIGVKIENSKRGIIAVSFPNIVGSVSIGRINQKIKSGVVHKNLKTNDYDPAKGETTIMTDKPDKIITQYNIKRQPTQDYWINQYENEEPWIKLNQGETPEDQPHEVTGHRDEPASMIITEYQNNEEIHYVYSWYFTGKHVYYPYGHYYQNNFKNSQEVAEYFMENYEKLKIKSSEWHERIPKNLPEWLRDAIINSTYILSTSTWLDEKGRFGIYEAPQNCPYLGTIGTCYEFGSLPVILMFPELEKSFLEQLASNIRDDGYVPHDLGYNSLDAPTDGTTAPPRWKDLNPTFILLIYRYFKFTKDLDFVKNIYPKLIKVLEWEFSVCDNGLPILEGSMDSAFDATVIRGRDSYVSSLFIASLIAMREICKLVGDYNTLKLIEEKLNVARTAFIKMFNGRYFKAWNGIDGCFIAQIFGEWWCELLGLESIVDDDKLVSALNWIIRLNGSASKYCVPNLVSDDGRIITLSPQTYSSWPRMVFATCWLAYRKGLDSLGLCEKEWNNLVRQGLVWDQPSRIDARTGKPDPLINYLDHYIGSPSLWSFLF
ncbi:GH116 family glycosyl hydrolase [Saccharolobus caldissimus]|uniref:Glycosyl-hydrolase family 116 catalytic region domain-containing protein n=1 Tax=Saccharolobus caldissimus TaxID=1702097 RepID=A0AAQ4CQV6_9CREN|nr:GH116 family glycosyl hydrolase [Saccharolobus caldissimus]BDB98187.1 hypothetical protein SACC_12040 [Saccharolobus caldissimus]